MYSKTQNDEFKDPSFDAKHWINQQLKEQMKSDSHADVVVSNMIRRLQFARADVSASIDETTRAAMRDLPHAIRDIERLEAEASVRNRHLHQYEQTVDQLEFSSQAFIGHLASLDRLKQRLVECQRLLGEANRLHATLDALEAPDSMNGDLSTIAARLAEFGHSLDALHGLGQFDEERERLQHHQQALEGRMRPALLRSFAQHDVAATRDYLALFEQIERRKHFLELFYQSRIQLSEEKLALVSKSAAVDVSDGPETASESVDANASSDAESSANATANGAKTRSVKKRVERVPLDEWLPKFYEHVADLLKTEREFVRAVFDASFPVQVLPALTYRLFVTHADALETAIGDELERVRGDLKRVDALLDAHRVATHACAHVLPMLSEATRADIEDAVFKPFLPFLLRYAELEAKALDECRRARLRIEAAPHFGDTVSRVERLVTDLLEAAELSLERCVELTGAAVAEEYVNVLQSFICDVLEHVHEILLQLRVQARLDLGAATDDTSRSGKASKSKSGSKKSKSVLPQLASTRNEPNDWSFFQGALQLLQIVGSLSAQLRAFETQVRARLAAQRVALLGDAQTTVTRRRDNADVHDLSRPTSTVPMAPPLPVVLPSVVLRAEPQRAARLRAFFARLDTVGERALAQAAERCLDLSSDVQSFVFDTMFALVKDRLGDVPQHSAWLAQPRGGAALPTFSLAPLPYINQVGEHLLTLPQHLAPYADNEQLLRQTAHMVSTRGTALASVTAVDADEAEDGGGGGGGDEDEEDDEAGRFARTWIAAVAERTMKLYTQRILEIRELSEQGAAQLGTDVGYLCNVFDALGIRPDASLEAIRDILSLPRQEWSKVAPSAKKLSTFLIRMRERFDETHAPATTATSKDAKNKTTN